MRDLMLSAVAALALVGCAGAPTNSGDRRTQFVTADTVFSEAQWPALLAHLDPFFRPYFVGGYPDLDPPRRSVAVARLDIDGDGAAELWVTPLDPVCRSTYCFTLVLTPEGTDWARRWDVALARGTDGLPYLLHRRGGDAAQQVLCTTAFCFAGHELRHCTTATDRACVPPQPANAPQRIAWPDQPVAGERTLALVKADDFARVDNFEGERAALEAWVAAEMPAYIAYATVREYDSVLGGLMLARLDLDGRGARDLAVAGIVGHTGGTGNAEAVELQVLRRIGTEFYTDYQIDNATYAYFAQVPPAVDPTQWWLLRSAFDEPELWGEVGGWLRGVYEVLHPDLLRRDPDRDMRVNVWVARYRSAAGDEFLLFDNYQGGIAGVVDSAYRLRRVDGQLRLVGRTAVADGAVANVIADQDGNRRVVGTWRFEGERY